MCSPLFPKIRIQHHNHFFQSQQCLIFLLWLDSRQEVNTWSCIVYGYLNPTLSPLTIQDQVLTSWRLSRHSIFFLVLLGFYGLACMPNYGEGLYFCVSRATEWVLQRRVWWLSVLNWTCLQVQQLQTGMLCVVLATIIRLWFFVVKVIPVDFL